MDKEFAMTNKEKVFMKIFTLISFLGTLLFSGILITLSIDLIFLAMLLFGVSFSFHLFQWVRIIDCKNKDESTKQV